MDEDMDDRQTARRSELQERYIRLRTHRLKIRAITPTTCSWYVCPPLGFCAALPKVLQKPHISSKNDLQGFPVDEICPLPNIFLM